MGRNPPCYAILNDSLASYAISLQQVEGEAKKDITSHDMQKHRFHPSSAPRAFQYLKIPIPRQIRLASPMSPKQLVRIGTTERIGAN